MPKSVIFTAPLASTMTFAGFTSRCTTSLWCANARPSAISAAMSAMRCGGRTTPESRMSRSDLPSRNSIAMYATSSLLPTSWMVTTLGWLRRPADFASRKNRRSNVSVSASREPDRDAS